MNLNLGYARVSTQDQLLDLQLDALTAHSCQTIYQEHASGKSAERPELENCLKALRSGDTLIVWRLDRLTESTSWATQQSIAIMAVDNLRPSEECLELMRQIDAQKITHETAVLTILQKAVRYATNT